MIPWLDADTPFPPLSEALAEPNGLLCAGGELSVERMLNAYLNGIFPWYSPGDPVLWWSPDPRMVLLPGQFRISRSLRQTLRRGEYEIRLDTAFEQVIAACAQTPRPGQSGTWIVPEIVRAYTRLHELGLAHSVETWTEGELIGGLYGVGIGGMFYGESMFAHRTDASKLALAHLCAFLADREVEMIDCQMYTPHLASLGAAEIPRAEFMAALSSLTGDPQQGCGVGRWPATAASRHWT